MTRRDPELAGVIAWYRWRIGAAQDKDERRLLRESLARLIGASRPPKPEPPKAQ
jgi:hypothetical protein